MTIRHLKIFLTVAETGKMSMAAEQLYITQPSVSQAIRELEDHYQVLLFERLSKKLYITEDGKKLYVTAKQLVTQFESLEESMRKENRREKIRIGGTVTLGSGLLSKVVRDLRGERPELDIYSYMNNTQIIEQKLLNMELDVGIVEGRVKSRDLVSIPLIDDMLVLACGQNHLYFGRHTLFINELNGHDFVKREPGSGTRELFENFIVRHGLDIHTVFEESTPDSIKNAIQINNCMAVISIRLLEKEIQNGEIHVFTGPHKEWNRSFSFVYHKDKFLTEPILRLKEIVSSYNDVEEIRKLPGGQLVDG